MADAAKMLVFSAAEPETAPPMRLAPTVPEYVRVGDLADEGREYVFHRLRWKLYKNKAVAADGSRLAKRVDIGGELLWALHRDAPWPDGRTVADVWLERHAAPLSISAPASVPPGLAELDAHDQRRHLAAVDARRGLAELVQQRGSIAKAYAAWVAVFGERCRAAGIGRGMPSRSTAERLMRWDPARELFADGRRQRGRRMELPGDEDFRADLMRLFLECGGGERGTFRVAFQTAAGLMKLRRGLEPPSEDRARRWMEHQVPPSLRGFFRDRRAWERATVESVRRDYAQYRPGQVWVGDWHRLDMRVFHRGRWGRAWLCVWEDMATRDAVGWMLAERPDTSGLLAAFAAGVLKHGAPEQIIIDNGRDFASKAFAGGNRWALTKPEADSVASVCGALGIDVHFCWPFNPGAKPVESFFRGLATRFSRMHPTYTGNKPGARRASIEADLKAGRIAEYTWADLERDLAEYFEVYRNTPHTGDGMNGATPAKKWADQPIAKRTAPPEILATLLTKRVQVTVTRRGALYGGVHYQILDAERRPLLLPMIGQTVTLHVNYERTADAASIEVWSADDRRRIGTATNSRLCGASGEDVAELRRRQKGARKIVREATAAMMDAATTPLDMQALNAGLACYMETQRKAAGAESMPAPVQRDLALLPGAAAIADQFGPRAAGGGRTGGGLAGSGGLDDVDFSAAMRRRFGEAEDDGTDAELPPLQLPAAQDAPDLEPDADDVFARGAADTSSDEETDAPVELSRVMDGGDAEEVNPLDALFASSGGDWARA